MNSRKASWWLTAVVCVLALGYAIGAPLVSPTTHDGYDIAAFGKLPVSYGGRHKPLDTVARNSLTILSGRQTLKLGEGSESRTIPAVVWLLDVQIKPQQADGYPVFRIYNKEVLAILGLDGTDAKHFSYHQITPARGQIQQLAEQASRVDRSQRSVFQHNLLGLASELGLYESLRAHRAIHNIPLTMQSDWATYAQTLPIAEQMGREPEALSRYKLIYNAYVRDDAARFNTETAALATHLRGAFPERSSTAVTEWHFNRIEPFSRAMEVYVVIALLVMVSWLVAPQVLLRPAIALMVLALLIHTAGLVVRVYLSGRPPVTNLYSSAVAVGWGVVGLSLLMEFILRGGLGLIVGAVIGFASLLVAQGLSADGDTMAVLQAVLDTNFWLATHVIVIIIGYVGVFVAGGLATVYIFKGVFTTTLDKQTSRNLARAIYGITCLSILTSFVGTILGGIWADQSWGRFWGWDPKENGALLIVLWCAIMLHARWGGLVRERGLAVLAVFGNVVCAWSWFGTNMLGAGLHSYGFTEAAFAGMMAFVTSQAVIIALGTMPPEAWRSGKHLVKESRGANPAPAT